MRQRIGNVKVFVVAVSLSLGTFFFQNCTRLVEIQTLESASKLGISGDGYAGKYFIVSDERKPCADSTAIQAAIRFDPKGQGYLMRDNCVDIAPNPISSSSLIPKSKDLFEFEGRTFHTIGLSSPILECISENGSGFAGFSGTYRITVSSLAGDSGRIYGQVELSAGGGEFLRQTNFAPVSRSVVSGGVDVYTIISGDPGEDFALTIGELSTDNSDSPDFSSKNLISFSLPALDVRGDSGRGLAESVSLSGNLSCQKF